MFSERLREARNAAGLSQEALGKKVGLRQSSVWQYEANKSAPTPEMIVALADVLNVTVAWLLDVDEDYSMQEQEIIKKYRALDQHGRIMVDTVLDLEKDRNKVIEFESKKRHIPLIDNSFAAGIGEPDIGGRWTSFETDNDKADFALRISGDSMTPYLPDGSIQYGVNRTPQDGEIAVLLIDGEFLVKQIAIDSIGNLYLFSLNRERKDADRILWAKDDHTVSCFGTVLMKRVPLPHD